MKIYITRHGIRLDKVQKFEKSDYRRINPPLVSYGYQDLIEKNKDMLVGLEFDYIFSSPFLRCVQTAHFFSGYRGTPILIEDGVGEVLRQHWFDRDPKELLYSKEEMKKHYHSIDLNYSSMVERYSFPERRRDSRRRVSVFLDKLLTNEQYKGKVLLLVGHGFSIKDVACYFNKYSDIGGSMPGMGKMFYLGDF